MKARVRMWETMRVRMGVRRYVEVRVRVREVPSSLMLGTGRVVARSPLPDPPEEYPCARARCVCGYAGGAAAERSE